jgi:hypothetical protein
MPMLSLDGVSVIHVDDDVAELLTALAAQRPGQTRMPLLRVGKPTLDVGPEQGAIQYATETEIVSFTMDVEFEHQAEFQRYIARRGAERWRLVER